jgi:hypothetical protein
MHEAEKLNDLVRLLLDIERDCANHGLTHTQGLSSVALGIAKVMLANQLSELSLSEIECHEDFSKGIKLVTSDGEKVD